MQAKPAGRRPKRSTAFDIHIGLRLRQRRTALGLGQPDLAAALGVSFQQIQKYEYAKNRISAGRLYELSKALGVPITYFFEGLAETEATTQKPKRRPTGG